MGYFNMHYNISVIQDKPSYESLPALKLINFPKGNYYKPFTQVKPATDGKNLYVRFLVFEAKPEIGSMVSAIFKNCEKELFIECGLEHCNCVLKENNCKVALDENSVQFHRFEGEDLQGIYWAVDVTLPLKLIYNNEISNGNYIMGNFYKYSKEEHPHNGSLYPADFSLTMGNKQNLGKLEFMKY